MKNQCKLKLLSISTIVIILVLTSCSRIQNWPQFRGPDGNMFFTSNEMPEEWGDGENILWTSDLNGTGFSSPIIWENKVFITSAFPVKTNPIPERGPAPGPPPQSVQRNGQSGQPLPQGQGNQPVSPPQQGRTQQLAQGPPRLEARDTSFMNEIYRWEVKCFDLSTGKELWKKVAYEGVPKEGKNPNSTYACETPATDGKRIFASFGMHGLYCYDMEGNLLWNKDFGPYYTQRGWGTGSSPVLYNDVLYIQFDNEENSYIIALDAASGNEKWRTSREEKTTYSTPFIWKNRIRDELVTCGKTARSYDPETGKVLWELNIGGEQVIPSPVGNEEFLYLGNPGGREIKPVLIALKAGSEGQVSEDEIIWKSEESGLGNASPLLYDGYLYIIGGRGEISVLDALTGEIKYQKRISGIGACWASPWNYNNKIFFIDENGVTRVFIAGEPIEIVVENKLEGSKFWSSVAVSGNAYIFKAAERLYCIRK